MKTFYALITLVLIHQLLSADTVEVKSQSLQFSIPEEVEFKSKEELEMYSFTWGEGTNTNLLILYPHPMPSPAKMVKPMADMMEISFEESLAEKSGLELVSTKREADRWGLFTGEQLAADLKSPDGFELTNYMFILHDGERIWNGQLSGADKTGIVQAVKILSSTQQIQTTEEANTEK